MDRRNCLISLAAFTACMRQAWAQDAGVADIQSRWRRFAPEDANLPSPAERIVRTEDEWRRALEPRAFEVLREAGTEPAHSSPLNAETRPGLYACAGCGLPLFSSEMKFDSGTGWPSFFTTIPDVFATKRDFVFLIPRVEYHCVRCGGHHGHVFDDGPEPTGERWCSNGVALRFLPAAA